MHHSKLPTRRRHASASCTRARCHKRPTPLARSGRSLPSVANPARVSYMPHVYKTKNIQYIYFEPVASARTPLRVAPLTPLPTALPVAVTRHLTNQSPQSRRNASRGPAEKPTRSPPRGGRGVSFQVSRQLRPAGATRECVSGGGVINVSFRTPHVLSPVPKDLGVAASPVDGILEVVHV